MNIHHTFAWTMRPATPALREMVERIEAVEPTPNVRQRLNLESKLRRSFFTRPGFHT